MVDSEVVVSEDLGENRFRPVVAWTGGWGNGPGDVGVVPAQISSISKTIGLVIDLHLGF